MRPSDFRHRRATRRIFELGAALSWIGNQEPLRCAVCGEIIGTLRQFKDSRSGHDPDFVHKRCWYDYVWRE